MKEIYEEPKLHVIGFLPKENLAADTEEWRWDVNMQDGSEATSSEVDVEYGDNPEGGYNP